MGMSGRHRFDPPFEALPEVIPIFPLPGVLLLPGGRLPLNIFEPRYLNMTADALKDARIIGMIQPLDPAMTTAHPDLYRTGCAGRIVSFAETEDGRYLITLKGLARFEVAEELPLVRGYRRVRAHWAPFQADMSREEEPTLDRERFFAALARYFKAKGIRTDWEAVRNTQLRPLLTTLAMTCPFEPAEKQALLEAATFAARAEAMIALLEMAAMEGDDGDEATRQ
jgi:Lon protease-like protein